MTYVEPPLPVCACEYPGEPLDITADEATGTFVVRRVCSRCFDVWRDPDDFPPPPPFNPDPELIEDDDWPRWAVVVAWVGSAAVKVVMWALMALFVWITLANVFHALEIMWAGIYDALRDALRGKP